MEGGEREREREREIERGRGGEGGREGGGGKDGREGWRKRREVGSEGGRERVSRPIQRIGGRVYKSVCIQC